MSDLDRLLRTIGTGASASEFFFEPIHHQIYIGDTALHVAAAANREDIVRDLIAKGADARARNRRGAEPLHYAADGSPGWPTWNPKAQAAVVKRLLDAGADPNAIDKNGATPLHRAVRTRCSAVVRALLERGADPRIKNPSGSTPRDLAVTNSGKSGSGSVAAKAEQAEIIQLLGRR